MPSLIENYHIVQAWTPVDINGSGVTGVRFHMAEGNEAWLVAQTSDVAAVVTYTVREHTAQTSGTSQDLASGLRNYWRRSATTDAGLLAAGQWTNVAAETAPEDMVTVSGSANLIACVVRSEEMDRADDMEYLSVNLTDPSASCIAAAIWIVGPARYGAAILSSILD